MTTQAYLLRTTSSIAKAGRLVYPPFSYIINSQNHFMLYLKSPSLNCDTQGSGWFQSAGTSILNNTRSHTHLVQEVAGGPLIDGERLQERFVLWIVEHNDPKRIASRTCVLITHGFQRLLVTPSGFRVGHSRPLVGMQRI